MTRGFLEDDKTKLAWNLPRVLLAKNRVKLLLNMLLIAGQAHPARRHSSRSIRSARARPWASRCRAAGTNAKVPPAIAAAARRASPASDAVDAHAHPAVLHRAAGQDLRARGRAWRSRARRWW